MARPRMIRLLPDPEQHDLLASTLQRVNKASNAARTRALSDGVTATAALRTVVKEELDRLRIPAAFSTASLERVKASLTRQKFGPYQSLVLPASALKWPSTDRVTMPTVAGKRTVRVYVDQAKGVLRPPLEDKPAALVFRNGEFQLVDASAEPDA